MRKKYLSALLFGALLFASAGTFTSCKDYDDDINNLQEQIDVIVADLNDLKTLVGDGGVSSVTFDEATGVLTVVDAAGTKTYTVKTPAAEVGEVKVVIDDERNLVVNDEVIGKVGDVVTVNAEGYLCVNGVATEIKAGKYAILENESDNTYTITLPDAEGNMQTITLLKSVATNIAVTPYYTAKDGKYSIFTEINPEGVNVSADEVQKKNGIAWGVAASDIDWKGPKGAVKAGQLLIGQQNFAFVQVNPQNVELDKQSLKLVDIKGNVAPVTVQALPSMISGGHTGSRSVATGGMWVLDITMDNTITANNIGTAFAQVTDETTDGNYDVWSNKTYALQVNGNIVTGYNFVIDTDAETTDFDLDKNKLEYKADNIKLNGYSAPNSQFGVSTDTENKDGVSLNENHYLTIEQGSVYDYKFEIVNADENDAEAWGITLENNVLKGTNAASGKTIHLNVTLLGVNGQVEDFKLTNKGSQTIAVTFGKISSEVMTLPTSTYKVTPDEYDNSQVDNSTLADDKKKYATMVLDMGDLFSGLTAQEAIDVQKGETTLRTTDETFVFLRNTIVASYNEEDITINFYKADNKTQVKFDDDEANIREIKYAHVIYNMPGEKNLWNYKATLGEHILTMTLTDAAGNEIRKANIPVNVTVPTFFELFTKSGAWTDNTALAVVDENGKVDLKQLYNDKSNAYEIKFFDMASTFKADGKSAGELQNDNADPKNTTANTVILNKEAVKDHALKDLSTELVYKIVPECPAFWVTSGGFTMDVVTKLDAAKFVYYGADGKETNIIVRPETKNTIAAYKEATKDTPKTGLSFYKAGEDNIFKDKEEVNGLTLLNVTGTTHSNLAFEFDDKAGDLADVYFDNDGSLIVSGLAKGNYTTVLTITYKKASVVPTNVEVWETFEIPLTVQGVE